MLLEMAVAVGRLYLVRLDKILKEMSTPSS